MDTFMQNDLEIHKIPLVCYVKKGGAKKTHINRPSHGLMFNCNDPVLFIFSDGKRMTVPTNAIILLPQGSDYTVNDAEHSGNSYAINFTLMQETHFDPFFVQTKDSKAFLDLFKKMEKAWTAKKPGYILKCKSLLYSILYMMQKENFANYANSDKRKLIQPAVSYMHEHYTAEPLKVVQLAAMCGITPEYFRSIFQSFYGVSPIKYINRLKMEHASELLSSGMYSVTEAATLSGYNDLSHFSREFKKIYGVKPTEY